MTKKLTPKEALFVEAYCSMESPNATEAARQANYGVNAVKNAYVILQRSHVAQAVEDRRKRRKQTFWVTEEQILKRFWEEANFFGDGASHAARITALTKLGTHMGMDFNGSKASKNVSEENRVTLNIVNYDTEKQIIAAVEENRKEIEQNLQDGTTENLLENLEITDYSETVEGN